MRTLGLYLHAQEIIHHLDEDVQISVTSPPLWYEIHLSGKTYRVRGLGVAGCPGILIGWNDHVAWGVTALGSDPNDLYRLTLDPSSADRYRYEGRTLEMETRQETLRVKEGEPIPLTVRRTHLGPVVTPFLTAGLLPGEEYALRYQVLEDRQVHTVQGLVKMMRARDWESFKQGLQDYRSPGIHVLYADARGNIGYHTAGAIPIRPKAAPLGARLPHDGSSSAFAIRETIPSEMLPQMFNPRSGVIATANNLPVGAWYPFDLAIGTGGGGDTIRSWRLRELLAQKETVEPAEVRGFHNDCVNPAARELVRLGLHARQSQGFVFAPEAAQALEVLQNWNGTALATQPAAPLVHHIADNLVPRFRRNPLTRLFGGGESGVVFWLKTRKTDLERNPGLELDADELNYIQAVLSEAWNQTVARSGRDPSRWLDRFHTTLGLPYQQTLENFGSLDPSRDYVSPPMECIMVSTIWSQWGNSYSQFVDFGDGSASLLPPGLSELADSSFFQNQITLWAAGQLAPAPLEEQAIRETAVSRKTLTRTFDPFSARVPRFPFVDTRGARFTGIALSSATPREIRARLTWYGNAGEPLAGPNLTNPAIVRCPLIGKQSCAWWALPCSGAPAAC
ncbi:MAG: penicillin acylase family protein [Acidobacteria bacterium]|nr:penicillin acylase family protein [Acidobacteriota bacterium]